MEPNPLKTTQKGQIMPLVIQSDLAQKRFNQSINQKIFNVA